MTIKKKRCTRCPRWFVPDPRIGERQRFCSQAPCQKMSKKESQRIWLANIQNYYKREVRKIKARRWAKDYPDYWKSWRRDHPDYVRNNRKFHIFVCGGFIGFQLN